MVATAVKLDPSPASTQVANRALLPDLESGACMSLAATHAGSGQTVFIDPGHGGLDPGVVGGTAAHPVLEKDATLAVPPLLPYLPPGPPYPLPMPKTQPHT